MATRQTSSLASPHPPLPAPPASVFPPYPPRPPARESAPSTWERVRSSTWLPIGIRLGAVAIALFVLAWIGRAAAAPGPSATGAASEVEAGIDAEQAALPDGGAYAPALAPPVALTPPPPPAVTTSGAGSAHASAAEPVYINHASVDELRRLPGVGPKRAEAILLLRQRLGRFQRVEDLLRVKGVGRGAVKKWRSLVRLDTPGAGGAAEASDAGSR